MRVKTIKAEVYYSMPVWRVTFHEGQRYGSIAAVRRGWPGFCVMVGTAATRRRLQYRSRDESGSD